MAGYYCKWLVSSASSPKKELIYYLAWRAKKPILQPKKELSGDGYGYVWEGLEVRDSEQTDAGKGVFATKDLQEGTMIPICGRLHEGVLSSELTHAWQYYVTYEGHSHNKYIDGDPRLNPYKHVGNFGLSIAMMVNESSSGKFNCAYHLDHVLLIENIKKGQELYVFYGKGYEPLRKKQGYSLPKTLQGTTIPPRLYEEGVYQPKQVRARNIERLNSIITQGVQQNTALVWIQSGKRKRNGETAGLPQTTYMITKILQIELDASGRDQESLQKQIEHTADVYMGFEEGLDADLSKLALWTGFIDRLGPRFKGLFCSLELLPDCPTKNAKGQVFKFQEENNTVIKEWKEELEISKQWSFSSFVWGQKSQAKSVTKQHVSAGIYWRREENMVAQVSGERVEELLGRCVTVHQNGGPSGCKLKFKRLCRDIPRTYAGGVLYCLHHPTINSTTFITLVPESGCIRNYTLQQQQFKDGEFYIFTTLTAGRTGEGVDNQNTEEDDGSVTEGGISQHSQKRNYGFIPTGANKKPFTELKETQKKLINEAISRIVERCFEENHTKVHYLFRNQLVHAPFDREDDQKCTVPAVSDFIKERLQEEFDFS